MSFLNILKHLLPSGRAWQMTVDKQLRQFFEGLGNELGEVKVFLDDVWDDIFPDTTRDLDSWENQFGLRNTVLTTQERRDRLAATWKQLGGQSPRYLQDTLQANGFNVFVHEWWLPGSEPVIGSFDCATPQNPFAWLRPEYIQLSPEAQCGKVTSVCGNASAICVTNPVLSVHAACLEPLTVCGNSFAHCGNTRVVQGYPLVNKISQITPAFTTVCGALTAVCGNEGAACGTFFKFNESFVQFEIPTDEDKWSYFVYIGGQTFGDIALLPVERRNEFEALLLRLRPAQLWIGVLVAYTI